MKTERKILLELEKNSRITNQNLAKKLGVSEGTVRNKIKRMISKGYIKRFTIERSLRFGFGAMVIANTNPKIRSAEIANELRAFRGVRKIYETAGDHDMIVEIYTDSPEDYNEIIENIRNVKGIANTNSLTILKID